MDSRLLGVVLYMSHETGLRYAVGFKLLGGQRRELAWVGLRKQVCVFHTLPTL